MSCSSRVSCGRGRVRRTGPSCRPLHERASPDTTGQSKKLRGADRLGPFLGICWGKLLRRRTGQTYLPVRLSRCGGHGDGEQGAGATRRDGRGPAGCSLSVLTMIVVEPHVERGGDTRAGRVGLGDRTGAALRRRHGRPGRLGAPHRPVPLPGDRATTRAAAWRPTTSAATLVQTVAFGTQFWGNVDVRQGVTIGGCTRRPRRRHPAGARFYKVNPSTRKLSSTTEGASRSGQR